MSARRYATPAAIVKPSSCASAPPAACTGSPSTTTARTSGCSAATRCASGTTDATSGPTPVRARSPIGSSPRVPSSAAGSASPPARSRYAAAVGRTAPGERRPGAGQDHRESGRLHARTRKDHFGTLHRSSTSRSRRRRRRRCGGGFAHSFPKAPAAGGAAGDGRGDPAVGGVIAAEGALSACEPGDAFCIGRLPGASAGADDG